MKAAKRPKRETSGKLPILRSASALRSPLPSTSAGCRWRMRSLSVEFDRDLAKLFHPVAALLVRDAVCELNSMTPDEIFVILIL